ncbi:MAG: phosphoadenylyl-sulfate reductase [Pseudomonadota bacterium]
MPYSDGISRDLEPVSERTGRLNRELRHASAQTILRVALLREWPGELTYVSSFGAESAVMLALIADVDRSLPIVFLETGMHFPQTLDYRDRLIEELGLTAVRSVSPNAAAASRMDPDGTLHRSDPDACCELRKVQPLEPALGPFRAWITGRKRFHGGERIALPVFEHAGERFKINPLAGWDQGDVERFLHQRSLPRHPLVRQGYPSIGCWPCTQPSETPGDVRSGRWAGFGKSECGLHVDKEDRPRVF